MRNVAEWEGGGFARKKRRALFLSTFSPRVENQYNCTAGGNRAECLIRPRDPRISNDMMGSDVTDGSKPNAVSGGIERGFDGGGGL